MIINAKQILADIESTRGRRHSNTRKKTTDLVRGKTLVHGTATGYNYGCHCDECRAAHATDHRRRLERRKLDRLRGVPLPDRVKHGTENAYKSWACRCDLCTAGHDERKHDEYRRQVQRRNEKRKRKTT